MQVLPCLMKRNQKTSLIQMRWARAGVRLLVTHSCIELLCKAREGQSSAALSCEQMAVRNQSLFPLEKVSVKAALGYGTAPCVAVWGSQAGVHKCSGDARLKSQMLFNQHMTPSMNPDG